MHQRAVDGHVSTFVEADNGNEGALFAIYSEDSAAKVLEGGS
jgi:hypothetical protein